MSSEKPEDIVARIRQLSEKNASMEEERREKAFMMRLLKLLPQGPGSGLNADLLDDLHAEDIIQETLNRLDKRILRASGGGGAELSPHVLGFHSDIAISSPADGQILKYDGPSEKWKNADCPVAHMDFWSDADDEILLPAAAADVNLPDIVVAGIPTGVTIVRVTVMLKLRTIENTSATGSNAIQGAQNIRVKKSTGSWGVDDVAAMNLIDNQWTVAASTREMGDVQIGDIDVKSEVDGNATYNLRFENADVDYDNLKLNDVQVGIRVYFK